MKKVLCIHAHESNIYYLDRLLIGIPCIIEHKIISLTNQSRYSKEMLRKEIDNFFSDDIIACVLTCTVHCSILDEDKINGVPILKIEDPIIEKLSHDSEDKVLLFTNPNTVELTVNKIKNSNSQFHNYEVEIIPNTFGFILKNQKILYKNSILEYIHTKTKNVYLMQLSMSVVQNESLFNGIRISNVYKEAEKKYIKIISDFLKKDGSNS